MIDVEKALRRLGRMDALALRAEAKDLTGTDIIAREVCIPDFDPNKDYSAWPSGAPVTDGGQVWLLIQPYNAAWYVGRPADLRALWGLAHTTDPAHAKLWVSPYGTSGLYYKDECYMDEDGRVFRCAIEQTNFTAAEYPAAWEVVK